MSAFDNIKEQAGKAVDEHSDQVDQGVEKAGQIADAKTGGGHGDQIAQGTQKARDGLDALDGQDDDLR
jgi:hypothetical protein